MSTLEGNLNQVIDLARVLVNEKIGAGASLS
jgi:hypothetical protein